MKVIWSSPSEIKLYISKAILAHQKELTKKYQNKEITYEELRKKEFPIDAANVLDEAVKAAFDEKGYEAILDAEKFLKSQTFVSARELGAAFEEIDNAN